MIQRRAGRTLAALVLPLLFIAAAAAQDSDLARIGPVARNQLQALAAEKEARTPAQRKIDSGLLLAIDAARVAPRFPELLSLQRPLPDADDLLTVDIDLFDGARIGQVLAALKLARAEVLFASARFRSLRARVHPLELETLAAAPNVRFVAAQREFATNKATTSQGDLTHQAALVRANLGYTGNGQKLCALSDGVNSLAARQATGDLPAGVEVLPGQAGSGDEGTAMLEILHDLAPGARLGFAAVVTAAGFAQNILDLADPAQGGCTVIVDDVGFFDESPFQDGIIAQAVNAVTAAGVSYFSSAANSGNLDSATSGTWEGDFDATNNLASPLLPGHILHEFNPATGSNPALSAATRAHLHWAEPAGVAATDYDLYVLDSALGSVLASSTTTQDGTQDAYEYVINAGGSFPAGSRLVVAKKTGAGTRMLNVQWYRGRLTYATAGATRGHSAAANAFGVAATPAASPFGVSPPNPTGPYPLPFNTANKVELFSSDGPRRIFFDGAGNLLPGAPPGNFTVTGGVVRDKPDVTAADGVATSAPGFNPFFGTSAAAPHAAAAAALLRQAFPAWTMAQLRTALTGAAIDIHAPGWDRDSGAGIVMPLASLQAAGAPAIPALVLESLAAAEVHGNGSGQADAGEDWRFDITLGNTGGIAAAGTVATLIAHTPGVAVTSAPIAYGGIAVNGSAANPPATPFRFSIFDIVCGQDLDFTLSVTTAASPAPQVFPIRIPTMLVAGSPQTFSYTGPSVAIPDASPDGDPGATVAAGLAVSGVPAPTGSVRLRIDGLNSCTPNNAANAGLDHTFVGDLLLELRSPGGATIPVVNQIGGGGGTGMNFCDTTLDDLSPFIKIGTAAAAAAPFTGSYKPDAALGTFLGTNANGTWELRATDKGPEDIGHINRFSLIVAPAACTPVAANVAITAAKSVSGAYYPGGAVTYTVTLSNTGSGAQADNPGDEYADTLPPALTAVPAATTASAGAIAVIGNTVRWNGAIAAGTSVTLTLAATINPGTLGALVVSQGAAAYDADHDGSNDSTVFTDDPLVGGAADPTVFTVGPPTLDIDGNGSYDALTDGLLVIRHLFGLSGGALVDGAIGDGAARDTPAAILNYLAGLGPQLDADGNGSPDALTDGMLALRYMFGLRGPALVAGAIGDGATRSSPEDVEAFLAGVMP